MSNVISLAHARARAANAGRLRTSRPSQPGTVTRLARESRSHAIALSCVVVDAVDGVEYAGVPSTQLADCAEVGEVVWARSHEGQWFYVTPADVPWQASHGWTVQQVRMVRVGTPLDVVVDDNGNAVGGISVALRNRLKAGPQWAFQRDGAWRLLCDGAYSEAEATEMANGSGVGGCLRIWLRLERREAGK